MSEKKFVVKDSGKRQEFETGAVRDIQEGKGRFDLIPPHSLKRLAKHYEEGAKKYGDCNYLKGIPTKRIMDSALRHINNYREGDAVEDNLIAAIWNLIAIVETEHLIELGILPENLDTAKFYTEVRKIVVDDSKNKQRKTRK
jgi:hypothetical protein